MWQLIRIISNFHICDYEIEVDVVFLDQSPKWILPLTAYYILLTFRGFANFQVCITGESHIMDRIVPKFSPHVFKSANLGSDISIDSRSKLQLRIRRDKNTQKETSWKFRRIPGIGTVLNWISRRQDRVGGTLIAYCCAIIGSVPCSD